MRTLTAPQIALLQNREGKLSVTFTLAYRLAAWNATGAVTLEDVFEYWFDKEKCEIELKDSADLGVLLSYYNTQMARIIITETVTDGVTTVSEPSPPYFVYSYSYLPKGRLKLYLTSLHFQQYDTDPVQPVDTIIQSLLTGRDLTAAFIAGQEWFDYDWSPAGSANIDLSAGDLPRILGKRYMVETFARESDILFQNRYNSPNRIVDYTPFTTDIETIKHTSYNIPINGISWTDETDLLHFSTGYKQPVHHLGFIPRTATGSIMNLIDNVLQSSFKFTQWPDLRLENGDWIRITLPDGTYNGMINCTHHYRKQGQSAPLWEQTVEAVQVPKALGVSRTPNRFMFPSFQISPLSLELDTEHFRDILDRETQSVQAAMDRLDRHHHYSLVGHCDNFNPADATNYYIGAAGVSTVSAEQRVYVPHGGVINHVYAFWSTVGGLAGSAANISLYLQKNGATDSGLIETINDTAQYKFFHIENLGFTVDHVGHDYISLKLVCPTWAPTNPTSVKINWVALLDPL